MASKVSALTDSAKRSTTSSDLTAATILCLLAETACNLCAVSDSSGFQGLPGELSVFYALLYSSEPTEPLMDLWLQRTCAEDDPAVDAWIVCLSKSTFCI